MWTFFQKKGVIKFELKELYYNFILNEDISFKQIIDRLNNYIDIPFFESFSDIYIYVHGKNYINVYSKDIDKNILKNNNSIVCATIHYNDPIKNTNTSEYITKYYKMFLCNVTPEILLLNYDNLDIKLDNNLSMELVDNNFNIIKRSLNEII
jgi:hypothetical protein